MSAKILLVVISATLLLGTFSAGVRGLSQPCSAGRSWDAVRRSCVQCNSCSVGVKRVNRPQVNSVSAIIPNAGGAPTTLQYGSPSGVGPAVAVGVSSTTGPGGSAIAIGANRVGYGTVVGQDALVIGSSSTLGASGNTYAQGGNTTALGAPGVNAVSIGGNAKVIPGVSTLGALGLQTAVGGTANAIAHSGIVGTNAVAIGGNADSSNLGYNSLGNAAGNSVALGGGANSVGGSGVLVGGNSVALGGSGNARAWTGSVAAGAGGAANAVGGSSPLGVAGSGVAVGGAGSSQTFDLPNASNTNYVNNLFSNSIQNVLKATAKPCAAGVKCNPCTKC